MTATVYTALEILVTLLTLPGGYNNTRNFSSRGNEDWSKMLPRNESVEK